jgi:hypothetical protein
MIEARIFNRDWKRKNSGRATYKIIKIK